MRIFQPLAVAGLCLLPLAFAPASAGRKSRRFRLPPT
jgi:hypothetical protein